MDIRAEAQPRVGMNDQNIYSVFCQRISDCRRVCVLTIGLLRKVFLFNNMSKMGNSVAKIFSNHISMNERNSNRKIDRLRSRSPLFDHQNNFFSRLQIKCTSFVSLVVWGGHFTKWLQHSLHFHRFRLSAPSESFDPSLDFCSHLLHGIYEKKNENPTETRQYKSSITIISCVGLPRERKREESFYFFFCWSQSQRIKLTWEHYRLMFGALHLCWCGVVRAKFVMSFKGAVGDEESCGRSSVDRNESEFACEEH